MDDIIDWFKNVINSLKAVIYLAATIIAIIPVLDIGTKIYLVVILGLILLVINPLNPREARRFTISRVRRILLRYVTWVVTITLISEVLIPYSKIHVNNS